MIAIAHRNLPLTLTLSPLTGRGDEAHVAFEVSGNVAASPFSPPAGRRWRQPDEGRILASEAELGKPALVNKNSKEARYVSHS